MRLSHENVVWAQGLLCLIKLFNSENPLKNEESTGKQVVDFVFVIQSSPNR